MGMLPLLFVKKAVAFSYLNAKTNPNSTPHNDMFLAILSIGDDII